MIFPQFEQLFFPLDLLRIGCTTFSRIFTVIRKIDNVVQRKGVCWLSLWNDARAKTSCSKEWRSVFFDEGGRKRGEGEKRSGRRAWPSGIPGFAKSARRGWFSVSTGRITGACLSLPDKPAAKRRRWLNRSRGCDLSSPLDQPDVWKREREREGRRILRG